MPAVIAAIAWSVAFAAGATAEATAVIFAATQLTLYGAASIGLSYGVAALQKALIDGPAGSSPTVNAPEVRGTIKQDVPPHRIWIGPNRGGGVVFLYEKKPPYLYLGLIHSVLPMSAVTDVYIAQQKLTFSKFTPGVILSPLPIDGQPSYDTRLQVCFQLGEIDQPVNPLIAADLPEKGENFKLPGIANSVWRFDYGDDFDEFEKLWGQVQIPDAQIVAQGCPLPDPRETTNILDFDPRDMASLYAAIKSWKYTDNAAQAQAFWGAMPFGLNAGPAAVYQGAGVPLLKSSVDFDDEQVPLKDGGYQRRHTVSGIIQLDQTPLSVFESMLDCNNGFASPRTGKLLVSSSQPRRPTFTITDADIAGGFRFVDRRPKRERLNTPRAHFISPDQDWQDAETAWPSEEEILALQAADGEVFEKVIQLSLVATHQRAQRLLKSIYLRQLLGRTLSVICKRRLLGVVEGEVGLVDLESYPAANGLYEVSTWSLSDDLLTVPFDLIEYDPTIPRNWNAQTDEQPLVIEPPDDDEEDDE